MAEETLDASIRGPLAIRLAVIISGVLGSALTIAFCFCLTDFDAIMASPTGLPAAQIILNAGGQTGGTVMFFFIILVQSFTGCTAMLADTRMAYAFARDEALPLSRCVEPPAIFASILCNASLAGHLILKRLFSSGIWG